MRRGGGPTRQVRVGPGPPPGRILTVQTERQRQGPNVGRRPPNYRSGARASCFLRQKASSVGAASRRVRRGVRRERVVPPFLDRGGGGPRGARSRERRGGGLGPARDPRRSGSPGGRAAGPEMDPPPRWGLEIKPGKSPPACANPDGIAPCALEMPPFGMALFSRRQGALRLSPGGRRTLRWLKAVALPKSPSCPQQLWECHGSKARTVRVAM
ncbi:hypothetical protein NL676_023063 [Syzygium grande]|nr:hypothetical protein NL676_023063 [Syzygium grande]